MSDLKLSELVRRARAPGAPVQLWQRLGDPPAPCCSTSCVIGPAYQHAGQMVVQDGDPLCCVVCGTVYRIDIAQDGSGWLGARTGESLRPSALAALRRLRGWVRAFHWEAL